MILTILLAPLFPSSTQANGQVVKHEDTRLKLLAGWQLKRFDSSLLITSQTNPGALYIDLENDLGLDTDYQGFAFGGFYRFAEHHRLGFMVFDSKRASTKTLEQEIEIGDEIWEIGATLATDSKTQITEFNYQRSVIRDANLEIAILGGIYWLDFKGSYEGENNNNEYVTEKTSFRGPLPTLGLNLSYSLGSRWTLLYSSEVFAITLGQYSGRLNNHRLSAEYAIWNNLGVGLAINHFDISVVVDDDAIAEIGVQNRGVLIYAMARF